METKYVVEINEHPNEDPALLASRLSGIFNVSLEKAEALIRRLPKAVTKPVTRREAEAVAKRFKSAGLNAQVRSLETPPERPVAPPTGPLSTAPVSGAGNVAVFNAQEAEAPRPPRQRPMPPPTSPLPPPAAAPIRSTRPPRPAAAASPPIATETPPEETAPAPARPARRSLAAAARERFARRGPRPAGAGAAVPETRRRGSILTKIIGTAILPTLLTMLIALTVTWLTARPALYRQLIESARNPAIATAASLSSTLEGTEAEQGIDYVQLLNTIQITRQAFQRQNISFIVATDTQGNPLSAWFAGAASLTADSEGLRNAITQQAIRAIQQGVVARDQTENVSTRLPGAGGARIEVVSQPLVAGNRTLGAIVVGVTDDAVVTQVQTILLQILALSLIPVALAIFVAVRRARAITGNVLKLTDTADQISRGNLEASTEINSDDELADLSEALERMRISMKEALDRLRRRRA